MNIIIDNKKCNNCNKCIEKCKFNAIQITNKVIINDNCVGCNSCVNACKTGALTLNDTKKKQANYNEYKGVLVFIQVSENKILSTSLQLINKGRELANTLHEKLFAVLLGYPNLAYDLDYYGIDKIINYTNTLFNTFNAEAYISALYETILTVKPSIMLVGATNEGRQLASHLANKCNTGLTADCTDLQILDNNLLQIRPAYGGKIMAEIITENTRPQFATVKNGVFDMPKKLDISNTLIETIDKVYTSKNTKQISITNKEKTNDILNADIILCLGNGVKKKEDLSLFENVAKKLGAEIAGTRALVEKGFITPDRQIGLSGNGVNPKLLITFGVSGSVQFLAGVKSCKNIVAINNDKNATILKVANYSIVHDMYDIAYKILEKV